MVFTELGYDASTLAAARPWEDGGSRGAEARALQERCLRVSLNVLSAERAWLRGAFLWKWFVGAPGRGDASFYLDTDPLRETIRAAWR